MWPWSYLWVAILTVFLHVSCIGILLGKKEVVITTKVAILTSWPYGSWGYIILTLLTETV